MTAPIMRVQNLLRRDGTVEFEGVTMKFVGEGDALQPGDTYMAERNQGPRLLTVHHIEIGAVFPVENAYPYDLWECVKVEMVD